VSAGGSGTQARGGGRLVGLLVLTVLAMLPLAPATFAVALVFLLPTWLAALTRTLRVPGAIETVAGLNHWIGEAWLAGRVQIFDEHLYSEHIQNILRNAIIAQPGRGSGPRVLLTSLPGEKHRIGLLWSRQC
jgi:hypothetical protein